MIVEVDVRRLAAIDMFGTRGSPHRTTVILLEFASGAVAITGFGLWLATRASGPLGWILALAMIGVGTNYAPLAVHAATLRRPGRLTAELSGADTASELRRHAVLQLWILVPFSLVIFASRRRRSE